MLDHGTVRTRINRETIKRSSILFATFIGLIIYSVSIGRLGVALIISSIPYVFGAMFIINERTSAIRNHDLLFERIGAEYITQLNIEIQNTGISNMMLSFWFRKQARFYGVKHTMLDDF